MALQKTIGASPAYTSGNRVTLVKGGEAYFSLLISLVNKAKYSIHLQTYIFDGDETGRKVASVLRGAAQRGVKVYLLLDGYASQHLSEELIRQMKNDGIHFRWFSPLLRTKYFYFGRRLHQKVLVTDAVYSLVGGINISNRYNDMPGKPAWLDWAVYAEGNVSRELFYLCVDLWNKSAWEEKKKELIFPEIRIRMPEPGSMVRVRRNDWVRGKNQISRSYAEMFRKSASHIYIMSSYFLPGKAIRRNISAAVKRGVKITVIAAGKSDVWTAKQAERYIYEWLLRNGITLYEYLPNVLHAKLSTYDGKWVTAGSYNVNNISAYAAIELNLDILDETFAMDVESKIKTIIQNDCVLIDRESFFRKNTFFKKLVERACYDFIRIVFELFTFYFRKHTDRE